MTRLEDITIRTDLRPGDIGYLIYLHGKIYSNERSHGIPFEIYVAEGFCEFWKKYNPQKERLWLCEHNNKIIGSIMLKSEANKAQLRYFLIHPNYRGIKLGNKLLTIFKHFMIEQGYKEAFLWTTNELDKAGHLYKKFGFHHTEDKLTNSFGREICEQRYDLKL